MLHLPSGAFVTFPLSLLVYCLSLEPQRPSRPSDPGDAPEADGLGDPISDMGRGSWEIRSRKWDEAHARGPLAACRDGRRGDGIGDGVNATPSATAVASAAGVLLAVAAAVAAAAAAAAGVLLAAGVAEA